MAKPPIRIKRSAVSGAIPTTAQLALGELAINTADGKIYLKKDDGTESIVEIGASGGGYTPPADLVLYEKTDSGSIDAFDGSETRFQLRNSSGGHVSVSNALNYAISINGVIQKPNTGTPSSPFEGFYITANATTGFDIVFDTAPATGSDFFGTVSGTFIANSGTSGIKILDDISLGFNGVDTDFTLEYSGSTYTPDFPDAIVVSLGGVVQIPTDAYSISGSTISFTAAPPTGTSFHALSFEIGNAASFSLVDSVSSTSTTDAATPNSVKTAYDLANAALPKAGGTMTGDITFNAGQSFPGTFSSTGGALTGDVTLNAQSDLRFADSDSSNWVAFQAPAAITANITWTLPDADASVAGYALVSDGAGTLSWATAGGGATGAGGDDVFYENGQTVTTSYELSAGKNALSAGPIEISSGVTVTIPSGQSWVIV